MGEALEGDVPAGAVTADCVAPASVDQGAARMASLVRIWGRRMKWSEWLIKRSVDDFLFDPQPSDTAEDMALLAELRRLCCRELTSLESVRQLRAELKGFSNSHSFSERMRDVLDDVRGELKEIADDVRFAGSPRGRFVLFCNDYVQDVHKIIRSQPKFADAYIGAHVDREAVVVAGHVADEAALHELRAIINTHPPGVEVIWRVTHGAPH
jgi:hypothetical protein